jgi:hypothetical protein
MHPKIETWLAEAAQFKSERTLINCRRAWEKSPRRIYSGSFDDGIWLSIRMIGRGCNGM